MVMTDRHGSPLPRRDKILDPRLRRLVHDLDARHRSRLHADVERAFLVANAHLDPGTVPESRGLSKRVLVKLADDRPPPSMSGLAWARIVDGIYAVAVPVDALRALAATPGVQFISSGHPMGAGLDTSRPETRTDRVHALGCGGLPVKGAGVVVGIIDFGCDFTLDDFRNADGTTRIDRLWDQSLAPVAGERAPAGFAHGVEYTGDDINLTLGVGTPLPGAVTVRHTFNAGEHGTHVMGIAAGNGRCGDARFPAGSFIGMAPEATLVFVQPGLVDGGTLTDSVHVAEAMAYIFRRALELGRPCVINLSLGQNGGSHDGESVVERAIDRMLEEPGRALVVAAGNEHVWRGHACGHLVPGTRRTMGWRAGGPVPGVSEAAGPDRTPNEMELWYSSRDCFGVRVIDPAGHATPLALPDAPPVVHALPGGNRVFIESERFTVMNGDARVYIEVSPDAAETVRPGVWRVEIHALESRDGRFDAWIERDLRSPANGFADQSIFEEADFEPTMTLGTPATARRAIAVANYRHAAPQAISPSSGRGTTRDGRPKPEIAAPGTDILSSNSLGGRAVAAPALPGTRYPMRTAMSGTSMAAPHVAGIVALLLQRDPRLSAAQIAKILVSTARPPAQGGVGFDSAFGFGLVDARAAVERLL